MLRLLSFHSLNLQMRIKSHHSILLFTTLLFIVLGIYYPSLNGGFYHDDTMNLVFNSKVQIDTLDITSLSQAATSSTAGTLKRPISMGSFALNYYFFGDEPRSFRITNVILHFIVGIFIFLISQKIHLLAYPKTTKNTSYLFSAIVSIIWLIHPLHVSTVAYVVQRMAILSTLFSLSAILFYIIGRVEAQKNIKSGIIYLTLCFISILLGVYSKENAILTPIFILLIEAIIFLPRTHSLAYKKYAKYIFISIFSLASILTLIFYNQIHEFIANWYYSTREFSIAERLYTQARIILYYIQLFFYPNIQDMGLFHDDIPLSTSLFSPITTLFSIISIIIAATTAILIRKILPIASLGIGWFFIGHLLESTIIPLEIVYEHRNYLPSIGLVLAATDTLFHLLSSYSKNLNSKYYLLLTVAIILCVITTIRASQWADPLSFAYFETLHHPNSVRANHSLGLEYRKLLDAGRIEYKEDTYKYLDKASELSTNRLFSEYALLRLANKLNEPAKPIWIDRMVTKLSSSALRIDDFILLRFITNCTNVVCLLPKDAAQLLLEATASNPRLKLDTRNHAYYKSIKGHFLMQRENDHYKAEEYFIDSIQLDPHEIQYYVDYINLLLANKRYSEARKYIELAREHNKIDVNFTLLEELDSKIERESKN